jgi:F-type H+-transporting ATPase subunit epsilon
MATTIQVEVVSVEKALFSGAAELVVASAIMGEVGIAPRHAPLLTFLRPGTVRLLLADGAEESFYVSGGILEVQPNIVTILADTAERAQNLNEAEALAAKTRAETALHERRSHIEHAKAMAELAQAVAQLQTLRSWKKKHKH